MASLIHFKSSKNYWIKVYDPLAELEKDKYKSINTNIQLTKADLKIIQKVEKIKMENPNERIRIKLNGTKETKQLINSIIISLRDRKLQKKLGVNLFQKKKLSEGWQEYKSLKTRIGDINAIKPKTLSSYQSSIDKFIEANGDKCIDEYTNKKDFTEFLKYLANNKTKDGRAFTENSIAIYCRSLRTIWNYFLNENYCDSNIIENLKAENSIAPKSIDLKDMEVILNHLKSNDVKKYYIIRYLLLTGCRPSSALVQKRSLIDLNKEYMIIRNVKARKLNKHYSFPLYNSLKDLIMDILRDVPDVNNSDLLFHFLTYKNEYRDALGFWDKEIQYLLDNNLIKERYLIKQIRKTFISYVVNELEMPIYLAQKLANHTSSDVTENNYLDLDIQRLKTTLNNSKL